MPKMRASIRYTSGGVMLVSRGGRPVGEIDDVPAEYRRLAIALRDHPAFAGRSCCWGDEVIEDLAAGAALASGHAEMRALATCHHLTAVADEVRARSERAARLRNAPVGLKTRSTSSTRRGTTAPSGS